MFQIKLFADFRAPAGASKKDRDFLTGLREVRDATGAGFVNFAAFDYRQENPDSVHFLTYPMEWIAHYMRHFYSCVDPLLSLDYRRVAHLDWRESFTGGEQARLLENLAEYGIGDEALSIVLPAGEKSYGALSLIFRCQLQNWTKFKHDNMSIFREAACRITETYITLYRSSPPPGIALTVAERKVLELAAGGLTDAGIAGRLGIARWTVVSHMQSAKYKLKSPNRTAAVAKAIAKGMIRLPELASRPTRSI